MNLSKALLETYSTLRIVTDAPNLVEGSYKVMQLNESDRDDLLTAYAKAGLIVSQIRFDATAKIIGQLAGARVNAHAVSAATIEGPKESEYVLQVRLAASSTKESRRDGMSAADFEYFLIRRQ